MLVKNAQTIFNFLVPALIEVPHHHALFSIKNSVSELKNIESSLDHYLSSLRKGWEKNKLKPEDFDESFFTKIYKEAFHFGPIPKNRNHIVLNVSINAFKKNKHSEPFYRILKPLKCWIDMDQIANQLNKNFKINNVNSFNWTFRIGMDSMQWFSSDSNLYSLRVHTIDKVYCKSLPNFYSQFLLGCNVILGAVGLGLIIGSIAIASLILFNVGGGLIIGALLSEAFRSHRFYKDNKTLHINKLENTNSLSTPIEHLFEKHLHENEDPELKLCFGQKYSLVSEPAPLETNLLPSM